MTNRLFALSHTIQLMGSMPFILNVEIVVIYLNLMILGGDCPGRFADSQ